MQTASRRVAGLACVLAFALFWGLGCQPKEQSGFVTVNILGDRGNRSYDPGNITVDMGTVVTWINQDSQGHTVTMAGAFDSGPIPPSGGRWSWVASSAGTFTYHCLIHPEMNGTVTVVVPPPRSQ
jgi:plastocyanin